LFRHRFTLPAAPAKVATHPFKLIHYQSARSIHDVLAARKERIAKPRHAAALALVGWYLIATGDKFETDSGGGLLPTEWFRLGKFNTEAQSAQARQKIQTAATKAYEQDQLAHRKDTFHLVLCPVNKFTKTLKFIED
jgi:hypothetical protein